MSKKARVQKILEINFTSNKVKSIKNGFKINCLELREADIYALADISEWVLSVSVKRSGIGLVIVINLFTED